MRDAKHYAARLRRLLRDARRDGIEFVSDTVDHQVLVVTHEDICADADLRKVGVRATSCGPGMEWIRKQVCGGEPCEEYTFIPDRSAK